MLRTRLFFGLFTLVILLWSLGAAAMILLSDTQNQIGARLRSDYVAIQAGQSVQRLTSTLNSHYIPALASAPLDPPPSRVFYDRINSEMRDNLLVLRVESHSDERWHAAVNRLEQAFDVYFNAYEQTFADSAASSPDRERMLQSIMAQSQRLVDLSEGILQLAKERLLAKPTRAGEEHGMLFLISLVIVGSILAIIIYFQLLRHLVDPVVGLQRSMDEVRRGNFELTVPAPEEGSEYRSVIAAFNDMAAELKHRRSETDEFIVRSNLVNRAILESIPSPVFILGDDGEIIQINPAAEQLAESLGVSGRLPAKMQRILDECRHKGEHFLPEDPREALLFRINEEEFYFLPRIFRFGSGGDTRSGWAVLLHNVSRIRWLDDMKTNLLSTVSHEIKTPLTGIRMVLHLLLEERGGKLDPMQKTMVTSANEDCERLLATLNTLLDLSRAESGATNLAREPISLSASLDRATQQFEAAAARKGVTLQVDHGTEDLPEVFADPLRLDEVLNNLVSNAIKHSPRNGTVTLRAQKLDAEHLRASVIDQGPGVPEESQSRIFERFFRPPGQTVEGVGLGLFISREIMRAHEGRIGLRERTENQTEFYIDVPIA
jgi:NtrC-family two-component system sensor histidine kinase KinB